MATAADKDRFEAAVKIITGLPKDGPFQPSNDMKLKFYALFKQATLGPCTSSQPAFWDVVNRAKWSAWNELGDMPQVEAMRSYVDILKEVVETMTLDANVQDFLEKIGPIYEFVTDDGRVVSKNADINSSCRPDTKALEMLNMAKGGPKYVNGNYSPDKRRQVNGKITNGAYGPHLSEESDPEDGAMPNGHKEHTPAVTVRKIDLETGSDDEEFDDASDNQAFASVTMDIAPVQSSGSHSPLSYISTPRHASKNVQSQNVSTKNLESEKKALLNSNASLSPSRRRAATALGQLLRQLPELDSNRQDGVGVESATATSEANAGVGMTEDSIVRAWAVLRRIQAEQVQRAQDDDDWLIRRLKRMKHGKNDQRKHRGRGGNGDGGNPGDGDGGGGPTGGEHSGNLPLNPTNGNGAGQSSNRRGQRQLSGESVSSSSSSGTDSANLDFDPHVGAVLLRMHRELQHINRQLELVEGILITQQQMIRNVVAKSEQAKQKKMRLGIFSNLPWRTILFILAWPVLVNVLARIVIFRMRHRRYFRSTQ